jgi:hypothetical protein
MHRNKPSLNTCRRRSRRACDAHADAVDDERRLEGRSRRIDEADGQTRLRMGLDPARVGFDRDAHVAAREIDAAVHAER